MTLQQIALFIAGGFAWDVGLHLLLAVSGTEMKMFGITLTRKLNSVLAVTNIIITALLLLYAFNWV